MDPNTLLVVGVTFQIIAWTALCLVVYIHIHNHDK